MKPFRSVSFDQMTALESASLAARGLLYLMAENVRNQPDRPNPASSGQLEGIAFLVSQVDDGLVAAVAGLGLELQKGEAA